MFVFDVTRIGPHQDLLVVRDEQGNKVFEDDQFNSYPDYPQGIGIFNDGLPDPTLKNGSYLLKAKLMHLFGNNWNVLQPLNLDGSEALPVIRRTGVNLSSGIRCHFRLDNELHDSYVSSAGCPTQLKERFLTMRKVIGLDSEAVIDGRIMGVLIIHGQPTFPQPYEGGDKL